MINWSNSDDFYQGKHHETGKPVLLFIHSERLDCCNRLDHILEQLNDHLNINDRFFPLKVRSYSPADNDKKLINNHIFVASPILQVLNHDGSRSHEFSYVPRQTRHSKGYSYTHNENSGIFTPELIQSQLEIGLAKYHLNNDSSNLAQEQARALLERGGNDANALNQARVIIGEKISTDYSSLLDASINYSSLSTAVIKMLAAMRHIPDGAVMKEWSFSDGNGDWKWYTDCVRELSFQVYQELISAAQNIELAVAHKRKNHVTHQILANWHKSYRKLQADFIGVPDRMFDTIALRHERSLRENLVHCILCEGSAHGLQILNTLNEINNPACVTDFETHQLRVGEVTADIGPAAEVFSHYERVHSEMLSQLKYVKDDELAIKSTWWEPEAVSLKFRLDRLGWHLQDHICTHRKLLAEMHFKPTLSDTFSQVIFEGLAQVESSVLGFEKDFSSELAGLIKMINRRSEELAAFSRQ